MSFPNERSRRLRRTPALRDWVAETRLTTQGLVQPLFVCPGKDVENPISSMPGQSQLSSDLASQKAAMLYEKGIRSVILFGIPSRKNPKGTESYDPKGVVPKSVRAIKKAVPDMIVIGDVCLCEFTDHGHCGVWDKDLEDVQLLANFLGPNRDRIEVSYKDKFVAFRTILERLESF